MLEISICEDNPGHADLIRNTVEKVLPGPFDIHTYSSGENFEPESDPKNPWDIILMDIDLGDIPGISLAKKVNRQGQQALSAAPTATTKKSVRQSHGKRLNPSAAQPGR